MLVEQLGQLNLSGIPIHCLLVLGKSTSAAHTLIVKDDSRPLIGGNTSDAHLDVFGYLLRVEVPSLGPDALLDLIRPKGLIGHADPH